MEHRAPCDRDRLRGLLKRGDPALDGRDPSPEEVARWRRGMLDAAPRADRPMRTLAWAAGAIGASLLTLLLAPPLLREPRPSAHRPAVSTHPPALPSSEPGPPAPVLSLRKGPTPVTTEVARSLREHTRPAMAGAEPAPRRAQTVQFTAPNGTRIIWTLDPDFRT